MTMVNIDSGICGFITKVEISTEDMQNVKIKIESQCPSITEMGKQLTNVDGYKECFSNYDNSVVYSVAKKYCKHLACPVPTGIIKGIEVACGLALPKSVNIDIEK